uniref:Carbohydrate sulfotransferase n=1 Tax=Parastrongyloides trichosuri TaxID=131310 RepID=A0A0N4ZPW8_PARTI
MTFWSEEKVSLLFNMSTERNSCDTINTNDDKVKNIILIKETINYIGTIIVSFYILLFFIRISFHYNNDNLDNVIKNFPTFNNNRSNFHHSVTAYCLNTNEPCMKAYKDIKEDFVRKYVIAPKYKIINCIMPKCMSTVTSKIFSYLYDSKSYLSFDWKINGITSSHHKNDYSSISNLINKVMGDKDELNEWEMTTFIREPLDRFVSAFIDKCYLENEILPLGMFYPGTKMCYGCGRNMSCYLKEQYHRASMYSKDYQKVVGYEDQHTFPQNWFCNFGEYKDKYGIYKTTTDKNGKINYKKFIINILKKQNVEEDKIHFIETVILEERKNITDPNEIKIKEKKKSIENYYELPRILKNELLKDPYMYKVFLSMYYYDYLIFNYTIPLPKY